MFTKLENTSNFDQTQSYYWSFILVNYGYVYYTPVLAFFGTIGNLMSVYVFYNSKLKLYSTSQYLSALAISDTVFLVQLIPPWLATTLDFDFFYTGGFCQLIVYISYVCSSFSAWLVVAFTTERALAVIAPLRRSTMCTVTRTRYVIIGLAITSAIVNIPTLQFAVPASYQCGIDGRYFYLATRFNMVDAAISFTVPIGCITVMNAWIICSLSKFEKQRLQLIEEESQQNPVGPQVGRHVGPQVRRHVGTGPPPHVPLQHITRGQQRITRMLVFVSTVYIILNLPAYSIRFAAYRFEADAIDIDEQWITMQQAAALCFHTNFGINFFLYCLSGQNFRQALIQVIPYLRHRAERAEAARNAVMAFAPETSMSTSIGSNGIELVNVITVQPSRRYNDDVIQRWKFNNKRRQPSQPVPSSILNMERNKMYGVRKF